MVKGLLVLWVIGAFACTAEQKQAVDKGADALKQMCVALESYSQDAGLVLRLHVPESYRIQAIDAGAQ